MSVSKAKCLGASGDGASCDGDSGNGLARWSNPRVPLCLVGFDLGSLMSDWMGFGLARFWIRIWDLGGFGVRSSLGSGTFFRFGFQNVVWWACLLDLFHFLYKVCDSPYV